MLYNNCQLSNYNTEVLNVTQKEGHKLKKYIYALFHILLFLHYKNLENYKTDF